MTTERCARIVRSKGLATRLSCPRTRVSQIDFAINTRGGGGRRRRFTIAAENLPGKMADDILYRFTGVPPHHSLSLSFSLFVLRPPVSCSGVSSATGLEHRGCVLIEMFIRGKEGGVDFFFTEDGNF